MPRERDRDDIHIHVHCSCGKGEEILIAINDLKENLMAQIDDLNTAISGVGTNLAQVSVDLGELAARIDALQEPVAELDLSAEVAQLNTIAEGLAATSASLDALAVTAEEPPVEVDPNA